MTSRSGLSRRRPALRPGGTTETAGDEPVAGRTAAVGGGALAVKHEHRCGAEVHVLSERIAFGEAGTSVRQVFRDSRYQEVQFCPGCGVTLTQAFHDKELRCIDENMDYA